MPAQYRYAERYPRQIGPGLERIYMAELAAGFAAAAEAATRETSKVLREIGQIVAAGIAQSDLRRAHETIAAKGQDSVLRSYDRTVTARNKRRLGPYRDIDSPPRSPKNRRYAGNKLRQALADRSFYEADHRGIRFINVDVLNHRAKQWARLSAGAGGRGTGSRRRFEVRWGGMAVVALGLEMRPSPTFVVPKGYWFNPATGQPVGPGARGTSQFFPLGEGPRSKARSSLSARNTEGKRVRVPLQRRRLSRGIEARNFLDAGVRRIAAETGPTYERMHRHWFETKVATVRPATQTIKVSSRRAMQPGAWR